LFYTGGEGAIVWTGTARTEASDEKQAPVERGAVANHSGSTKWSGIQLLEGRSQRRPRKRGSLDDAGGTTRARTLRLSVCDLCEQSSSTRAPRRPRMAQPGARARFRQSDVVVRRLS